MLQFGENYKLTVFIVLHFHTHQNFTIFQFYISQGSVVV